MKTVEYSVIINKPITEVFAYIENLENRPKWEQGVVEVKVVSGNYTEPGSVIQITNQMLGKKMETVAEVVDYEKNKHVICRAEKPFQHEIANVYEDLGGKTKFTRRATANVETQGGVTKLTSTLLVKRVEKAFQKTVENAKKQLENS
ncbi:SRPBCC family protein [Anaerobacillus sp. CMMVII]|uniref:SRPBCC family protein n=1 Tax=Anaerobacillus sp. CMMVII TaxID=2755588 RepID=UPI0021B7D593|nr:SRPBCC family protein [Anaerobacillus sp. CMMVII]MCT8137682.1 SRPBCC family protein [Anaerobacillus sp. CMMVII]